MGSILKRANFRCDIHSNWLVENFDLARGRIVVRQGVHLAKQYGEGGEECFFGTNLMLAPFHVGISFVEMF